LKNERASTTSLITNKEFIKYLIKEEKQKKKRGGKKIPVAVVSCSTNNGQLVHKHFLPFGVHSNRKIQTQSHDFECVFSFEQTVQADLFEENKKRGKVSGKMAENEEKKFKRNNRKKKEFSKKKRNQKGWKEVTLVFIKVRKQRRHSIII
jgi:hypothetical protein